MRWLLEQSECLAFYLKSLPMLAAGHLLTSHACSLSSWAISTSQRTRRKIHLLHMIFCSFQWIKRFLVKKIHSQTTAADAFGLKGGMCAVTALAIALALSSCKKPDDTQTAGQKLDSAIGKTEQAAAEARVKSEQSGAEMKAKTEENFAKAGAVLKNATENAESAAKVAASKVIDKMDDMAITAAISAELVKDAEIKLFKINVDTKDGAVVLNGTVPTAAARERAGAIAKTFSGVQSVDNRLLVKAN